MNFFRRWFGSKPDPRPADPLSRGMAALAAGETDEALQLLERLGASAPDSGEAQLGLGMLRLRQFAAEPQVATLHDAVASLTRAVALLPESPEAHFYLAFAESFTLDTIDEAALHLARALQLDPGLAARAAEIQQRIDAGRASMQQQAIDPETVRAAVERYEAGQTLAQAGQHAAAGAAFEEAVARYPAYAEALLALGESYRQQGRADDAMRMFRQALAVRPRMFEAHVGLGSLYVQLGAHDRALEQLQLALQQVPDQPQVLRNVGLLQLATGNPAAAVTTFRRLCALLPGDAEPRLQLALAELQAGDQDAARESLARVGDVSLSVRQHQLAAQLADQLGDVAAAQHHRARIG